MIITAITQQKRDKTRFNIFVDGVFSFASDIDNLVKFQLHQNKSLTQAEFDKLLKETEYAKWFNKTLMFISRRPRSTKEVRDYLQKHEVGDTLTETIIQKLTEKKFLNDLTFTEWFVEQRKTFRPKGKRLLSLELAQKGVDKEVTAAVLNTVGNETAEAVQLITKKYAAWRLLPDEKKRKKVADFLARRGYSWDTISAVVREVEEL